MSGVYAPVIFPVWLTRTSRLSLAFSLCLMLTDGVIEAILTCRLGGAAQEVTGEAGEGTVGYLVGELNRGLEYMFIMMNAARYSVGQQGIGVSERAYQHALAYACERVQGRTVEGSAVVVAIARHPDVQRMLLTMKALMEAVRAAASERDGLRLLRDNLDSAIQAYESGVAFILEQSAANIRAVYASSVPYLMLAGVVHGGWQMARAVLACRRRMAGGSTDPFHREKLATGLFYAAHILPRALALPAAVRAGGGGADACGAAANIA